MLNHQRARPEIFNFLFFIEIDIKIYSICLCRAIIAAKRAYIVQNFSCFDCYANSSHQSHILLCRARQVLHGYWVFDSNCAETIVAFGHVDIQLRKLADRSYDPFFVAISQSTE